MDENVAAFLKVLDPEDNSTGGGTASAVAGAMAGALVGMVARLSVGRKGMETEWFYTDITEAAETLAAWQELLPASTDRHSYELSNMVLVGRLVTEAALLREESRGAHFHSDFPHSSPEWQRHIIFSK